ncbi:MAG: SIS domain-containing protein [Anaerolineales bacterium]|nr:SIS domain-containing protein [Anaerolineales bacterium]
MAEKVHMLEYIYENPRALQDTLAQNQKAIEGLIHTCSQRNVKRIILTGLGSSYTAAKMAEPLFQMLLPLPVFVFHSDDIRQIAKVLVDEKTLVVVISRSGERGSVIEAVELSEQKGAIVAAVTGVADSMLAKVAKMSLLTAEGPEITFPKTKSVMACACVLMQLGLEFATRSGKDVLELRTELNRIPDKLAGSIGYLDSAVSVIINQIKDCSAISVAGSMSNYGVALESAVKIQESSNRFTRGDSLAGLLHGPLGAVNDDWAVLLLVTRNDAALNEDILRTANKLHARTISVIPEKMEVAVRPEFPIQLPFSTEDLLAGLLYLPVVQLFAYHWAMALGMNPDAPAAMMDILKAILPEGREEPELRKE